MMAMTNIPTVFLVEDEPDHAQLIMGVLQQEGHLVNEIVWVKNGRQAVDYVFQTGMYAGHTIAPPGLIVLDLKLPELDGFEVLQRLKQDERTQTIPVVMLTTSQNADDVERALRLGANDYIAKPVIWAEFERKVREMGKYWALVSDAALARQP